MTKLGAQIAALDLLRRHPGWSDRRVARELVGLKLRASAASVSRWRQAAGLAPATANVETYPPPRRPGVLLACGHLVHPQLIESGGRCRHCP